jgi:hypothetical protein
MTSSKTLYETAFSRLVSSVPINLVWLQSYLGLHFWTVLYTMMLLLPQQYIAYCVLGITSQPMQTNEAEHAQQY